MQGGQMVMVKYDKNSMYVKPKKIFTPFSL